MPPKKSSAPVGKVDQKKVQKVVQDKTFGLKNKGKSAKVQKYVASVKAQAQQSQAQAKKKAQTDQQQPVISKKEQEKLKKEETNLLFRPTVQQQKVPIGVDPKSIVCEFFKQGTCTKGVKCKFSHDLAIARKGEKIDLYTDRRDLVTTPTIGSTTSTSSTTPTIGSTTSTSTSNTRITDTLENWGKDGVAKVQNNRLDIVCKYFLEAVETKKYGWFWVCPNEGDACRYRHALPPGFELKIKEDEKEVEEVDVVPLEQALEADRKALTGTHTTLTLELFLRWKEEKKKRIEQEKMKESLKKEGKKPGLSGREMFVFNPDLFVDDDEALDFADYDKQEDEMDPNVPHNIVTVTETSITLTRVRPTEKPLDVDGKEEDTQEEDGNEESPENGDDGVGVDVDESLFEDEGDLPEDFED